MHNIVQRFVPAHAALVDHREIAAVDMQAYFDHVFADASAILRAAKVRQSGPARCYYFTSPGETVDLAGGYPVRMDTVNIIGKSLAPESPFKVVRHGDLRTAHLRFQGGSGGLSGAWETLAQFVRDSEHDFGEIAWEDYTLLASDGSDNITVDLHWALA